MSDVFIITNETGLFTPHAIGELYFSPSKNEKGQPVSKYEGVVVGHIIRRDDGTEMQVRSRGSLPFQKRPLKRDDLNKLPLGTEVTSMDGTVRYTVLKTFPIYGDVWVKNLETGETSAKKYNDLCFPGTD